MAHIREDGVEWLTLIDEDSGKAYTFDLTFMLSKYQCSYGVGCHGVAGDPDIGCCNIGVTISSHGEFNRMVTEAIRVRNEGMWYQGAKFSDDEVLEEAFYVNGDDNEDDETYGGTKIKGRACIFHNPPDNELGIPGGCAFHAAALVRGDAPEDHKPIACYQYPIHYAEYDDDEGRYRIAPIHIDEASMADGGCWWCIDDPENYIGDDHVFMTMRETLIRMSSMNVWSKLYTHCQVRLAQTRPGLEFGKPIVPLGQQPGRVVSVPVTLLRKSH